MIALTTYVTSIAEPHFCGPCSTKSQHPAYCIPGNCATVYDAVTTISKTFGPSLNRENVKTLDPNRIVGPQHGRARKADMLKPAGAFPCPVTNCSRRIYVPAGSMSLQ